MGCEGCGRVTEVIIHDVVIREGGKIVSFRLATLAAVLMEAEV